jgi:serine/threonine-protein kinase HipA
VNKYEQHGGPGIGNILQLLKASDAPSEDQRIFMKAQIVFWIIGATDGHAKFQHFAAPRRRLQAYPLYDVICSSAGS